MLKKLCTKLVLFSKDYTRMHGQQNTKRGEINGKNVPWPNFRSYPAFIWKNGGEPRNP